MCALTGDGPRDLGQAGNALTSGAPCAGPPALVSFDGLALESPQRRSEALAEPRASAAGERLRNRDFLDEVRNVSRSEVLGIWL